MLNILTGVKPLLICSALIAALTLLLYLQNNKLQEAKTEQARLEIVLEAKEKALQTVLTISEIKENTLLNWGKENQKVHMQSLAANLKIQGAINNAKNEECAHQPVPAAISDTLRLQWQDANPAGTLAD